MRLTCTLAATAAIPASASACSTASRRGWATRQRSLYEKGCKITTAPEGYRGWWADNVELVDTKSQADSIKAAVDAARKSDVAIVVVGENESTNREAWGEQHRGDRDSLDLLGAQNDLVKAVVETGKPVIVLLINGRPLSVNYIAEHAAAIFEGWYMGEMGGQAFAEAVFGDINPGGKLPITFPHTVGALPDFYNHKPSDSRSYEFSTRKPLFAFGSGLSYTTFKFDNLKVEPQQILPGATAKVSVEVTNTGSREGDEVAELYLHQRVASVTQPVMKLTGFERVTLKPGEKRTVEFNVTPEMLKIWDINMRRVIEPGVFELMVGPSSDDTKTIKLTVAGLSGETGKPVATTPVPAGSESGVVSTFDDGKVAANYGMWIPAGDSMNGGKSKSSHRHRRAGRGRQQRRIADHRREHCRRAVYLCGHALFAGYCAHAGCESLQQKADQLLGQRRRRHLHAAFAHRIAQRPVRRGARDDYVRRGSRMEAVHVPLLDI